MDNGKYNLYDFISFPVRSIREKAKTEYFNAVDLVLSADKYNKNNPSKSLLKLKGKAEYDWLLELDDKRNESLDEIIRRINNQISLSDLTLLSLYAYYDSMQKYSLDDERYILNETLYRYECMHACFNYFNIQEKFKTVIRVLYKLNFLETGDSKKFIEAISRIKNKNDYLNAFYKECKKIYKNQDYSFVMQIRNDETHNIPCLDEVTFIKKDKNGAHICGVFFVKENDELYKRIKGAYKALLALKKTVQDIVDNYKEESKVD